MRVAFELLGLASGQMTGVDTYVRNLFREFVRLGEPSDLRVWVGDEMAGQFCGHPGVTEYVADNLLPSWLGGFRYGRSVLQWLSVSRDQVSWRPDVVHCTMSFPRPAWAGREMVLTVLDLHFLNHPEAFGRRLSAVMAAHCRLGVRRAGRVIAISEFVKQDIVRKFGCRPERVVVTHLGVDHVRFCPAGCPAELDDFRTRLGLPKDYLYYPASTFPYKNHPRLIESLAILRNRDGLTCPLVLTGAKKRGEAALEAAVEQYGLRGQIIRPGYLSTDDVARCYQAAAATVFPSLHEGFGLPVIEAMACGCPVACSATTSVGEVAGGAAELFDPTDPEAIADAIRRVVTDSARRDALRHAGLVRAAEFTWGRTAEQTLECYRSTAAF